MIDLEKINSIILSNGLKLGQVVASLLLNQKPVMKTYNVLVEVPKGLGEFLEEIAPALGTTPEIIIQSIATQTFMKHLGSVISSNSPEPTKQENNVLTGMGFDMSKVTNIKSKLDELMGQIPQLMDLTNQLGKK